MATKIYKIYKCTNNVNGKVYIGYTHKSLDKRIIEHKSCSKNGSHYLLHKALLKYGKENFSWEIIFESKDQKYMLEEMESYFIDQHNSYFESGCGYNMTYGGQGGMTDKKHTEKTKEKLKLARSTRIVEPMLGKKHSNEAKEKMKLAKLGKEKSIEYKEMCSERNKKRYLDPEKRKVLSEAVKLSWTKRKQKQMTGA